jgi:hypothetical protein
MGMPVKLSDELVLSARIEAEGADRSITAQIEHWAKLGRAAEVALGYSSATALKRSGGKIATVLGNRASYNSVIEVLTKLVSSGDRRDVKTAVRASGKPAYGMDSAHPGLVVREDPDGTRTPGRFVNRKFVPATNRATVKKRVRKAAG